MTILVLKREPTDPPRDYESVDIHRIHNILLAKDCIAPAITIKEAWEKYSADSLCISWLDTIDMTDEYIYTKIMDYLEPVAS